MVPSQDDLDDEQPLLVATAAKLIEQELKRPQITTIQALLLLSIIHCGSSRDTKGWLFTGRMRFEASELALTLMAKVMRVV